MSETALQSVISEGNHTLAKNAGMGVSKFGLSALNDGQILTHGLHGTFQSMNATASPWVNGTAAAVGGVGGLVAMGAVGVISAAVAQMDYRHEIKKMKETYRNEIAAQLGKPAKSVTDDDLYTIAKGDDKRGIPGNKIIEEEITKNKKERLLGVGLSAGATMATFGIISSVLSIKAVELVVGGVADTVALSVGVPPGIASSVSHTLFMVGEAIVGMGLYNVIKKPLHDLGSKLFGLDKETTHDRIAHIQKELAKGKAITQEEVLGVYVSANKELADSIKTQYGKEYQDMDIKERIQITSDVGQLVPLAQLTNDINSRKYDVGELAFAAEGRESGFHPPQETKPHSWMENLASRALNMFDKKKPQQQYQAPAQDAWHPANEQNGKKSFVERYAGGSRAASLGHVERLDQGREAAALAPQQVGG